MIKSTADGTRDQRCRAGRRRAWASDERGSATVMVALTVAGLTGLLALGIDLGALYSARSEAQRAADAAALAGASAFLEYQQDQARAVAEVRAMQFATSNAIRGTQIVAEDVTITVVVDSSIVRAHVRRGGVPTWFARIFGVDQVDIAAEATAWAGAAGAAQCVKPFALPDMWDESSQDVNGNRIWDSGERWSYDPSKGDRYARYSGVGGSSTETGYGSSWRNQYADARGRTYAGDYGRRVTVKVTDPRETLTPSFFLPWVLPPDGSQAQCGSTPPGGGGGGGGGNGGGGGGSGDDGGPGQGGDGAGAGNGKGKGKGWAKWVDKRKGLGGPGGGGDNPDGPDGPDGPGGDGGPGDVGRDDGKGRGAARYRQNICSCNASIIDLDTEYMIEPGNMVGPTYQGVRTLIEADPGAYWDEQSNTLVSDYGMDSPRVVTVALFDPAEISKPGRQYIRFNNFARIFLEEQSSSQDAVTGRILYYVPGVGRGSSGQTTGSLVRTLQLVR